MIKKAKTKLFVFLKKKYTYTNMLNNWVKQLINLQNLAISGDSQTFTKYNI